QAVVVPADAPALRHLLEAPAHLDRLADAVRGSGHTQLLELALQPGERGLAERSLGACRRLALPPRRRTDRLGVLPGELGRREAPRTGQSRRLAARLGTCETLGRVGRRAGCGGIVPRPLVFGREAVLAGHRLGR